MSSSRFAIEAINHLLAKVKSRRRISIAKEYATVKVNLGCGLAVAPGWINIDGSLNSLIANFPSLFHGIAYRATGARRYYTASEYSQLLQKNVFVHHDLGSSIPLNDSIADFMYSSHFFEHLYPFQANRLLTECYRTLKPGGLLRLSIPDLAYAINLYHAGQKDLMLKNYFFVEDNENHYSRHKYMYDFQMLKQLLEVAGFRNIIRCSYRQGEMPEIDLLDNREEESLFVEARR